MSIGGHSLKSLHAKRKLLLIHMWAPDPVLSQRNPIFQKWAGWGVVTSKRRYRDHFTLTACQCAGLTPRESVKRILTCKPWIALFKLKVLRRSLYLGCERVEILIEANSAAVGMSRYRQRSIAPNIVTARPTRAQVARDKRWQDTTAESIGAHEGTPKVRRE